jgi:hypothetical protein
MPTWQTQHRIPLSLALSNRHARGVCPHRASHSITGPAQNEEQVLYPTTLLIGKYLDLHPAAGQ